MADDITLTVRVRDLTRGDFERVRQRMRGMDGDIRRVAQANAGASDSAERLSKNIRGVEGRLAQLHRTGNIANHEMQFMRRTMGLLSRDLRNAARAGEITEDQFKALRRQLEGTRLDFDYLDRDIQRHNAVARAAHRAEQQRLRQASQAATQAQREEAARLREEAAARRRQEAEERRAERERERRRRQLAQLNLQAVRQRLRDEAAATREAEQIRAAAARRAAQQARQRERERREQLRRQLADQRRELARFQGGAADSDVTVRFRRMGDADFDRMRHGVIDLRSSIRGLGADSDDARRMVGSLTRDLDAMRRIMLAARDGGTMTRRELNSLTGGLDLLSGNMRRLRRDTDMGWRGFFAMRREIAAVRAQLLLLGGEGRWGDRMNAQMLLFQRRLRDTDDGAGRLRRSMRRMGDWGTGGLRGALAGTLALIAAMRMLGGVININRRWTAILLAVLLLLGPAAMALGAILVAVLGAAFLALGAFALKGSQQVQSAFNDMKHTVAEVVKSSAQPMHDSLIVAMGQVANAASEMQPALTAAFAGTAPLVADLVGAFTDLAGGMLPGLVTSLTQMGPAMEGFRGAMLMLGQGIGDMFAAMTAGGGAEALKQTWVVLGVELKNLLVGIGEFINMATQSGTATMLLVAAFRLLSGLMNTVEFGLRAIDALFGGLPETLTDALNGIDDLGTALGKAGSNFVNTHKPVDELRKDLAELNKEIVKAKEFEERFKNVSGPAKDIAREDAGVGNLDALLKERQTLTAAITAAENSAAGATSAHAAAVAKLRSEIEQLNTQNQARFDAQATMENNIATAFENVKKNMSDYTGAVRIHNGVFDLTHEKSRKVYEDFAKIAQSTREAANAASEGKAPASEIAEIWARGGERLVALGAKYEIPKAAVQDFIAVMMNTPELVVTRLEVESAQAQASAEAARAKISKVPKAVKSAVTLEAHRAMERASMVESKLNAINGKTAHTYIYNHTINEIITKSKTFKSVHDIVGATGGKFTGRAFKTRGFAAGGPVRGPGTGTSDDVFAPWLSNGEFVIKAASVAKYGERFLQQLNDGKLKLGPMMAKGGKVKKKAGPNKDAVELLGSMSISSLWKTAGTTLSPFRKSLAQPGDVGNLIKTINDWRDKIKKATSGAVEKRLVTTIGKTGQFLIKHQIALSKVTKAIDAAKDKLNDLKEKAAQLKEQVTSGIVRSGDITGATEAGKPVAMGNIMANLVTKQRKAAEFASMLATLQSRGLGGQAISEIATAGIDGGGFETAKALMKASSGTLQQINLMQKDIAKNAAAAGKTAADAMYAAGIKAAEGLVKTLQKQASKIAASMMNAVVALEKAIKKALGKKATGGIVGAATGGPRSRMTLVGEHGPEIVNLAPGSMVRSNPDSRRLAASWSGGGGQPVEIVIQLDGRVIARQLFDPFRAEIWHRAGGNVQKALGRGSFAATN